MSQPTFANAYHAYLLRVWRVEGSAGAEWRASLEMVGTGERRGFAQLEDLFAFLAQTHGARIEFMANKGQAT